MKKNLKKPLVSIITPVYNRQNLIIETINSVLNQDYSNIEYIVLDDGSTDSSFKKISKYRGRLKIVKHSNMGEAKTVNKGFKLTSGEIVGIVNSDDPLLPNAVSTIVKYSQMYPDVIVFYPNWQKINEVGKVIEKVRLPSYDYKYMVKQFHCVPGPGTFFLSSVAKVLNGRDDHFKYVSDFDFWLRAGIKGKFVRIPKFLATFRVHSGSASLIKNENKISEEHIALVKKYFVHPNLSMKLNNLKWKSYASAYYVAGEMCSDDLIINKIKYYLVSYYYSKKYFTLSLFRILLSKLFVNK